jgi:hypothetical protein
MVRESDNRESGDGNNADLVTIERLNEVGHGNSPF